MKDQGQSKQKNQLLDPIIATKFSVLGFKELKEIQKFWPKNYNNTVNLSWEIDIQIIKKL